MQLHFLNTQPWGTWLCNLYDFIIFHNYLIADTIYLIKKKKGHCDLILCMIAFTVPKAARFLSVREAKRTWMKTKEKKKFFENILSCPCVFRLYFISLHLFYASVVFAGGGNRQDYWKQNSRCELWLSEWLWLWTLA